ncbi:hypothetical protein F6X50_00935 [Dickeya dianthicola]|nr:hypothetical protein [Dickeya dianthicola]MZI87711.1 hypothetical protein [Dickeya dianthicola]
MLCVAIFFFWFIYLPSEEYSQVSEYTFGDNNIRVNVLQLESGGATVGFVYSYTVSTEGGVPVEILKTNTRDADVTMNNGVLNISLTGEIYKLDNRIRLHNKHETLKTRITVTHP